MNANWNGRHLGWMDSGGLPLHHAHAASRGGRHRLVGDTEGFETLGIAQQVDSVFDPSRSDLGTIQ